MDFGSTLLLIALFVLVALYIARPLLERQNVTSLSREHDLSHWLAERDRTLNALQELDFDYALGKIPEEDYPATRAWLVQSGADILRKIDELQPKSASIQAESSLVDPIEAAIAARRSKKADISIPAPADSAVQNVIPDDNIEEMIAARRRQHTEKAGGFCHKCGRAVQKSDLFCPKCGARLKTAE